MAAAASMRVLLADDHPDIIGMLRLAFQVYGAHEIVGAAGDGEKAVELAIVHQPDLVVLDLSMPVLNGFEAVPLIRQGAPHARIAVLSALDDPDSRRRADAVGVDLYLVKGMVPREMVNRLTELVLAPAGAE